MSTHHNSQVVRRYFQDAPHNPEICDEIFAPSVRFHALQRTALTPQMTETDPESEKTAYAELHRVWGDWR